MNLATIKEHIQKKTILPLYVFTGDEVGIMDIYIKKLSESAGLTLRRSDAVADIYGKLRNRSFTAETCCYVIRDDADYAKQEKAWDTVLRGDAQGDNVIILVYSSMDKRTKFYKRHTDLLVEFESLTPALLARYANSEIGLSAKNGELLAEICECSYSRLMLECNKISMLSSATKLPMDLAFESGLKSGLFFVPPKDAIFDLVDAFCKGKPDLVFSYLRDCVAIGESIIAILSVLYNNMRAILLVQTDGGKDGITQRTGLTAFQVKLAKEKMGAYTIEELVKAIKLIRSVEKGIKTGAIEQDMALEYLAVNII